MNKKILLIGSIIILQLLSGCIETLSKGEHNGQITAIEKSGLIWKTYSVYVKSDISSSQEDRYCVEDESLIPQLEQLSKNRTKITLIYRGELYIAPWRCNLDESDNIIIGVKE